MKRSLTIILAVVLTVAMGAGIAVFGDTATPGSENDPVVTKSYVDGKTQYIPLKFEAGQKITGDEGTEIILRSGEATAVDNGSNGISDLTSGKDLMTGNQVEQNHLILIPRSDGRGITAVTDIWTMIRGSYTAK